MIPSHKTIVGKLEFAAKAVEKGNLLLVAPDVIAADLTELGCRVDELPHILRELLEVTKPKDYTGTRPPQKSYEPDITGCELYAFKTVSKMTGCTVYYKFTINEDYLWLISLHRDRPEKKRM
jgi:hypothetical protein